MQFRSWTEDTFQGITLTHQIANYAVVHYVLVMCNLFGRPSRRCQRFVYSFRIHYHRVHTIYNYDHLLQSATILGLIRHKRSSLAAIHWPGTQLQQSPTWIFNCLARPPCFGNMEVCRDTNSDTNTTRFKQLRAPIDRRTGARVSADGDAVPAVWPADAVLSGRLSLGPRLHGRPQAVQHQVDSGTVQSVPGARLCVSGAGS